MKQKTKVPHASRKGTVLVLVLWILAAIGMLGLSFAAAVRTEIEAARNSVTQRQAYYLTRAGVEYAVFKLLEDQAVFVQSRRDAIEEALGLRKETTTKHYSLQLANGTVEIDAISENGKLNINQAELDLVFNVLIMTGLGDVEADTIAYSIQDWKDPDDEPTTSLGAEGDYYQSLDPPYYAKNNLFSVPEELLLVRGVTPEIYYGIKGLTVDGEPAEFYGLQKYFTTFSGGRRIDVNAAPIQIIAAIPGLSYDDALRIDELRNSMPLSTPTEIMERIPGLPTDVLNFLSVERNSLVYSIDAVGRLGENGAASRIRCVVRLGGSPKGYSIYYWNEANVEL